MNDNDPLARPELADAAAAAATTIARAHRRPAGLRRPEVISSESLMRGARISSLNRDLQRPFAAGPEVSAYSLLAPDLLTTTVRTFARAPLNVLARADVAAGGEGTPADPARVQALGRFITHGATGAPLFDRLAPAVVHAEIAAGQIFAERSELVARVAARAMAVHTGLDPRGFAVPETYLNRHSAEYAAAKENYARAPHELLLVLLHAWEAGGVEADAIARAA